MGITLKQKVIACGRFHLNNPKQGQIRYMGVSKNYRRLGIGSKLVKELEKLAMNHGANNILLNARNNIVDFYKSLNYEVIGPYTSDIQIPHSTMKKNLY
jgi:ribosomal protein S18 acetylase RimI-like enzyme